MYIYPFEKLEVWQLAKLLVVEIYKVTNTFPTEEKFGMISQMRRAAVSICSNLAEGAGRNSAKDQANFYGMSYSSLLELLNQILISKDLNWLDYTKVQSLRTQIEVISVKINSLRKATIKKDIR